MDGPLPAGQTDVPAGPYPLQVSVIPVGVLLPAVAAPPEQAVAAGRSPYDRGPAPGTGGEFWT